ncbi:thioredoxin family protein [Candidatus Uhrbacteria bacterium]|nr:thioredoxin family protein [Candidatus Uhrbacteria bacterium]
MALYEFYGETCSHCIKMMPLIDKLIGEGLPIEKLEVWNNAENAEKMTPLAFEKCPGVPFFINTESDQWICGEADEETVRKWAAGDKIEN